MAKVVTIEEELTDIQCHLNDFLQKNFPVGAKYDRIVAHQIVSEYAIRLLYERYLESEIPGIIVGTDPNGDIGIKIEANLHKKEWN